MSDEDDLVQKARAGFEDLCRALNMDEEAGSEAWRTYENISRNFTLEVKTNVRVNFRVVGSYNQRRCFQSVSMFTVTLSLAWLIYCLS